jgi:hypothetical protein
MQFQARAKNFVLLQNYQTSTGAHPASYAMDTLGEAAGACGWPLASI